MLYATPPVTSALRAQLDELDALRDRLGSASGGARPWLGQLRRQVRASTMESSVSIEGFSVPAAEAVGIVAGETPVLPDRDQGRLALASYARAMDHVGTLAIDPQFAWSARVVKDLHFDACHFQHDRSPGLWRTAPTFVTSPSGGRPAFTGPAAANIPALMDEAADRLEHGDRDAHVAVRAAMAHLHVVSIHPFRDGNGRISRIVQSLVLARDGLLSPEFNSIEETLGARTQDYYRVLQEVQGGRYQPRRSAAPWVRFCVAAHVEQARHRLAQVAAAAARWGALERLVEQRDWPDRLVVALEQSLFDGLDRASYAAEAGISLATASSDLRRLLDAGLVVQHGRTRSTRYLASRQLRERVV